MTSINDLVSDAYKEQLKSIHDPSKNYKWGMGESAKAWHRYADMLVDHQCKSILDYGCASGKFKVFMDEEHPEYDVREYDPGVVGKDSLPEPADFVVCCDVVEHIEPDYLDNVLAHINSVMLKCGYIIACMLPAGLDLPDGRNAHLIQEDAVWWEEKLKQHFPTVEPLKHSTGHAVFKIYK